MKETGATPLIEARELVKHFPVRRGFFNRVAARVHAVDNVSFSIGRGETLGLVGETGSGKTTVGRCLVRLMEPTSGGILFEGEDLLALKGRKLREKRREFQIVFQDPFGSLNPRMTVGAIVAEPLVIHKLGNRRERTERVAALLERVGLDPSVMSRYPHEFSGGQRQRVGIARAIALKPRFVVCDEPVSALDVSVQAQIVNLLQDLQEEMGMGYLFIAHGLNVVAHISTRTAVMYLGRLVEIGPTRDLFTDPLHPYTKALLEAAPKLDPAAEKNPAPLAGDIPSNIDPPPGCRFAARCPLARPKCSREEPRLRDFGGGRSAACHLA